MNVDSGGHSGTQRRDTFLFEIFLKIWNAKKGYSQVAHKSIKYICALEL